MIQKSSYHVMLIQLVSECRRQPFLHQSQPDLADVHLVDVSNLLCYFVDVCSVQVECTLSRTVLRAFPEIVLGGGGSGGRQTDFNHLSWGSKVQETKLFCVMLSPFKSYNFTRIGTNFLPGKLLWWLPCFLCQCALHDCVNGCN